MTTAAFDGDTLAVDSRIVKGGSIYSAVKLHQISEFVWIAGAGTCSDILKVVRYFVDGCVDEEPEVEDCEFIMIDIEQRKAWTFDHTLMQIEMQPPFAIGSGETFAMSAMLLGLDARQAVAHAAKLDNQTAGPVHSIDLSNKYFKG